jgi:hypothetical protein
MRTWQGQPRKMVEYEHALAQNQAKMSIVGLSVGCNLVMLKMTCSQSGCKVQTHFLAPPVRAIRGA